MKIAAAYIRVSTDSQTELSPDSQIKLIREYAKSHDMIVPDEYIFRDDGISGRTTAKRPQFNAMIGTAKKKPKRTTSPACTALPSTNSTAATRILHKSFLFCFVIYILRKGTKRRGYPAVFYAQYLN